MRARAAAEAAGGLAPTRPRCRRRRMLSSTGSRRLSADQRHELVGGAPSSSFHPCRPPRIIVVIVAITIDYDDDEASPTPPRQDVTFLAPVGLENWTPSMTESLGYLLPMLRTPPILVTSDNHVTPAIQIWHFVRDGGRRWFVEGRPVRP